MPALINVLGQQFTDLKVIEKVRKGNRSYWKCQCKCGRFTVVAGYDLTSGTTSRCIHCARAIRKKHGCSINAEFRAEYLAWVDIRRRCEDRTRKDFEHYGSRGIVVCERWQEFANFLADMGKRPSAEHSIDRIDNDGNYEPGNCRWATQAEQNRNRSDNLTAIVAGQKLCASELARLFGVNKCSVQRWIHKGKTGDEIVAHFQSGNSRKGERRGF